LTLKDGGTNIKVGKEGKCRRKIFAVVNGRILNSLSDSKTPTNTRIHYLLKELMEFDDIEVNCISFPDYYNKLGWGNIVDSIIKMLVALCTSWIILRDGPIVFFAYPSSLAQRQNRALFSLSKLLKLEIILDIHDTIAQICALGASDKSAISSSMEGDYIKSSWLVSSSIKGPLLRNLKEKHSLKENNIIFVPNAFEDDILSSFPYPYRSVDGRFNICYLGGLSKNRGIDLLVEACFELYQLYPYIKLFLFGWYGKGISEDLKNKIENSSFIIRKEVPREKIIYHLHNIDVFVMPYNPQEIYMNSITPTKLFEYIGTGIPIICTKCETVMELVDNKGIEYVDYNVDDFKRSIEKIMKHPKLREEMSLELMKLRKDHTWNERAKRIHMAIVDGPNSKAHLKKST
jgi:glycosyltransferase involved in cell wall biosynthesis